MSEQENYPFRSLSGIAEAAQDAKCCREQTAQEALCRLIDEKTEELRDLNALREALPQRMLYQAERALRRLIGLARVK